MDEQICSLRRKLEEDSLKLQSFYESFIKVKNEILGIQVDVPRKDDDDDEEEEEDEENNEDAMDVEEWFELNLNIFFYCLLTERTKKTIHPFIHPHACMN